MSSFGLTFPVEFCSEKKSNILINVFSFAETYRRNIQSAFSPGRDSSTHKTLTSTSWHEGSKLRLQRCGGSDPAIPAGVCRSLGAAAGQPGWLGHRSTGTAALALLRGHGVKLSKTS